MYWPVRIIARPRLRDAGFTLIELLAVLIIAGFLASLVAPKLFATYERIKASAEEKKLREVLEFAKSRSFLRQTPFIIRFDDHTLEMTNQGVLIRFEYIRFSRSALTFNANGFSATEKLNYYVRGRKRALDLSQ